MTMLLEPAEAAPAPETVIEVPRSIDPALPISDKVFFVVAKGIGISVLVIMGAIGVFLGLQSIPTFRRYGFSFFTESSWQPENDVLGIAAVLVGTFTVALVAMLIAFPLALSAALYISEYAAPKVKSFLISMVDLMAAIPSIVWGLWGFFLLQPKAIHVAHWLHTHLGWIPFFHVDTDPNAAPWAQSRYAASAFIAGIAVSMMVLPMAAAVMRQVFSQAPIGEREAALALGSTRWGMIRTVVLPFGRGGIIGGTMLSLGRALGETIAVVLIISPAFDIKFRPLEIGTSTVSALIAGRFGEATSAQLSALLTAGFVLFVITLIINTLAATIVARSRSGANAD
ncbi:MAG: phosphate ABC transporter permease subunit PstC [Actinomycetes bacterium]